MYVFLFFFFLCLIIYLIMIKRKISNIIKSGIVVKITEDIPELDIKKGKKGKVVCSSGKVFIVEIEVDDGVVYAPVNKENLIID